MVDICEFRKKILHVFVNGINTISLEINHTYI